MPTYQYACTECGHQHEAVQSFSDPALTVCPNCQGKLRKVFNSVGIVFKGSGFYRNDSRAAAAGAEKANGAAAAADSSGAGSSSSGDSSTGASSGGSSSSGSSSAGSEKSSPAAEKSKPSSDAKSKPSSPKTPAAS